MFIVEAYTRTHFLRTYDLGAIGSHPSLLVFLFQYLSICNFQFPSFPATKSLLGIWIYPISCKILQQHYPCVKSLGCLAVDRRPNLRKPLRISHGVAFGWVSLCLFNWSWESLSLSYGLCLFKSSFWIKLRTEVYFLNICFKEAHVPSKNLRCYTVDIQVHKIDLVSNEFLWQLMSQISLASLNLESKANNFVLIFG